MSWKVDVILDFPGVDPHCTPEMESLSAKCTNTSHIYLSSMLTMGRREMGLWLQGLSVLDSDLEIGIIEEIFYFCGIFSILN